MGVRRRLWHRSEKKPVDAGDPAFAIKTLEGSRKWYDEHASRARLLYFSSETALLVVAASVPVSVALSADRTVTAVLGAVVVVLTGLRPVFRWREDWVGFTDAYAQLETERALYSVRAEGYAGGDRDTHLVERVREIEELETRGWVSMRKQAPPNGTT